MSKLHIIFLFFIVLEAVSADIRVGPEYPKVPVCKHNRPLISGAFRAGGGGGGPQSNGQPNATVEKEVPKEQGSKCGCFYNVDGTIRPCPTTPVACVPTIPAKYEKRCTTSKTPQLKKRICPFGDTVCKVKEVEEPVTLDKNQSCEKFSVEDCPSSFKISYEYQESTDCHPCKRRVDLLPDAMGRPKYQFELDCMGKQIKKTAKLDVNCQVKDVLVRPKREGTNGIRPSDPESCFEVVDEPRLCSPGTCNFVRELADENCQGYEYTGECVYRDPNLRKPGALKRSTLPVPWGSPRRLPDPGGSLQLSQDQLTLGDEAIVHIELFDVESFGPCVVTEESNQKTQVLFELSWINETDEEFTWIPSHVGTNRLKLTCAGLELASTEAIVRPPQFSVVVESQIQIPRTLWIAVSQNSDPNGTSRLNGLYTHADPCQVELVTPSRVRTRLGETLPGMNYPTEFWATIEEAGVYTIHVWCSGRVAASDSVTSEPSATQFNWNHEGQPIVDEPVDEAGAMGPFECPLGTCSEEIPWMHFEEDGTATSH